MSLMDTFVQVFEFDTSQADDVFSEASMVHVMSQKAFTDTFSLKEVINLQVIMH